MIKKYWSINPNFLLRSIVSQIIIQNKLTDLSFIYQVIKNNREENESKKLLIFFAIKNQEWKIARENISGLIGSNPLEKFVFLWLISNSGNIMTNKKVTRGF